MMVSEFIQELKHAFFFDASILSEELATLRLMTYGERLAYAIELAGASRKDVAKELGVSVQAIGQAVRGETNAHTAENQARAAKLLEVDYFWLATGEGKARPVSGWPFTPELHKHIQVMDEADVVKCENLIRAHLGIESLSLPKKSPNGLDNHRRAA